MSQYDELMDLVITEDTIEEYKERRALLREFHYTKNELQDPEILNKIIQKTKEQNGTYEQKLGSLSISLGLLLTIVSGIISGSITTAIVAFLPGTAIIMGILYTILNKIYYTDEKLDKNIKEIQMKVEKLKKASVKLKDKNASNKIISNCDKVLDSINKYFKNVEKKKEEKKKYEATKLDNYLNAPYEESDMGGEFRDILRYLRDEKKVTSAQIVNALCTKYKSLNYDNVWELMYGRDDEESQNEYPALYKKYLSLADKNHKVYIFTYNDDNFDFVSPVTKKLYSITTDNTIETISENLFKRYIDE